METPFRDTAMNMAATVLEMGHTRLQLAAVELEEARLHMARRWIAAVCTLYCAALALLLGCAWVVLATPAEHRVLALGLLTALSVAATAGAAWFWRNTVRATPPLLSATAAELERDAWALRGGRPS